jgi:HSP20 family protein
VKKEYNFKSFKRVFTVPKSIDKKEIDAHHENGVLTIILKKKEEEVEKGPIEINVK